MAKKREPETATLFELPPPIPPEPKIRPVRYPVWTENKAMLIQRYLLYFAYITKHGNYIDGFAGPQEPDRPEMWAARLVIESRPRWFRKFFLVEIDHKKDPPGIGRRTNPEDPSLCTRGTSIRK